MGRRERGRGIRVEVRIDRRRREGRDMMGERELGGGRSTVRRCIGGVDEFGVGGGRAAMRGGAGGAGVALRVVQQARFAISKSIEEKGEGERERGERERGE